jgi:hypothetical protein
MFFSCTAYSAYNYYSTVIIPPIFYTRLLPQAGTVVCSTKELISPHSYDYSAVFIKASGVSMCIYLSAATVKQQKMSLVYGTHDI